jgi:CRISPR/Cas system CMR subunit Cmr4 (Cas7 group RAMP superfamily)
MKLAAGRHLLRLEALTPAHLGSAAGDASLDRPCQKDALWGLPFVPESALKGVWAGRLENSFETVANPRRERIFGSPDRPAERGRPAPLSLGNGDLLCFPLPVAEGPPAWVFPALHLARLLRLDPGLSGEEGFAAVLGGLESSSLPLVFAWPALPRAQALSGFQRLTGASVREEAEALREQLLRYAGPFLPAAAPLLVVANREARRLWLAAAERRTLTALDRKTRTVREGTLREVELIPAGTVFVSLLTCEDDLDVPWPERLQVGAWEGLGCGWMRPVLITSEAGLPSAREEDPARPPRIPDEPEVMAAIHQAVQALAGQPDELRKTIKSAVDNFGPRAQFAGLEAALAFELAKAKPMHRKPGKEARAHRWLLSALLLPSPRPPREDATLPEAVEWLNENPFTTDWMAGHRDLILLRWQWLRRFAEFGLET